MWLQKWQLIHWLVKSTVLIVDNDPAAVEAVSLILKQDGFRVASKSTGSEALGWMRKHRPALIILELSLPVMDGLQVCKLLRGDVASRNIPILILTARNSEIDRVLGLELGADDYLLKPFSPRELALRVQKLMTRYSVPDPGDGVIQLGDLVIDPARHRVSWHGKELKLTITEFKLLLNLAEARGKVKTREQLLQEVWDLDAASGTRTVDTHIRRLRNKLGPAAKQVRTIWHLGYRLVD